MCFTQACCDHREVMQCMTCLVTRLCPLPIVFRCYCPCIRAMLSRLIDSVYFLLSSAFAVHAPSNAIEIQCILLTLHAPSNAIEIQCILLTLHAPSNAIEIQCILLTLHAPSNAIEIQCILLTLHAPSNAIEIQCILLTLHASEQRYRDSVYSVAVYAPSNAIEIQSILSQSMHRATLSRFSLFCRSLCTEQRYRDSVYSVAVHAPSNAIKIQSTFCCISLLQNQHTRELISARNT